MPSYTKDIEKILSLAQQHAQARNAQLVEEIDILIGLLELDNNVIVELLKQCDISKNEILAYIQKQTPLSKTSAQNTQLSYKPQTRRIFNQAGKESEKYNDEVTNAPHLLLAFAYIAERKDETLQNIHDIFARFNITYQRLAENFKSLTKTSKTPYLDKYGDDLSIKASLGKLDALIGRFDELEQMIQIMIRRRKNNPLLYGDAGVGKTAIVEGLALLIYEKQTKNTSNNRIALDINSLYNKRIIELSLYSIIAGASHRGEFEERLKYIIEETKNSNGQIILFIDEIHTIVGNEAGNETANILKPALARGEIQVIGATTVKEYHRYFEKDAALERRFQPVYIKEPSEEECLFIIQGLKNKYEKFHGIEITDEIIMQGIKLSKKFITQRFLPDKAMDIIDQACAAMQTHGITHHGKIKEAKNLIEYYLKQTPPEFGKIEKLQKKLQTLEKELYEITNQGQKQTILQKETLYKVIERSTGIPPAHLTADEKDQVLNLKNNLKKRIIGQDQAIDSLVNAIKRNRAGLQPNTRPIGSFIFMGPTGVGKTETAEVLAQELFGEKKAMVRLDMSEFVEKHAGAKLIGAPPGYIGYEEGGVLTEYVRTKPYTVVLFDEIEKAHPDVLNILLQILEEGHLTDNQGHEIDFKNTIVICTSNLGTELNPHDMKSLTPLEKRKHVTPHLQEFLKKELINRFDEIIYFDTLDEEELKQILELMIDELNTKLHEKNLTLTLSEKAKMKLIEQGYDPEFGARPLRRILQTNIETPLAELIIQGNIKERSHIACNLENGLFCFKQS